MITPLETSSTGTPQGSQGEQTNTTAPDTSKINVFEAAEKAQTAQAEPTKQVVAQPANQPAQLAPQQNVQPNTSQPSQQDLVKMVVEGVRAAIPQPQQSQQKQTVQGMTDQDFNKKFGVVTVDAATYEAVMGAPPDRPERVTALNNLMQGIARQAVLMSQALVQSEVGTVRESLTPLQAAHQKAYEESLWNEFNGKYDDLKGEKALIDEIVAAHKGKGTKFSGKEDAFSQVAAQARSIITRMRGPGNTNQQPSQSQTTVQPRKMTPTSMGGRGGTGQAAKKSTIEAVFSD